MLGEPKNQFTLTRAAPSTGGRAKANSYQLVPTNIVSAITGSQLQLSWPSGHTGWWLQSQTNAAGAGLRTNWVTVAGSAATNRVFISINTNAGSVFYRLVHSL
jgi:hypothetical protein